DLRRLSDPVGVSGPVDNMVDYFYAVLKDYGEAANRVSPGDLFVAVVKQTATIDALRRSSGSSAHRLLEVESRYAEQLGWLYQEAGNTDAAVYWCDRAWEFAHHAEDHQMAAYALARKSYLALQGDPDPSMATDLARAAGESIRVESPHLLALSYALQARGLALGGKRDPCLARLDAAAEVLAQSTTDNSTPVWPRE